MVLETQFSKVFDPYFNVEIKLFNMLQLLSGSSKAYTKLVTGI
jgi:hypothetical protein